MFLNVFFYKWTSKYFWWHTLLMNKCINMIQQNIVIYIWSNEHLIIFHILVQYTCSKVLPFYEAVSHLKYSRIYFSRMTSLLLHWVQFLEEEEMFLLDSWINALLNVNYYRIVTVRFRNRGTIHRWQVVQNRFLDATV